MKNTIYTGLKRNTKYFFAVCFLLILNSRVHSQGVVTTTVNWTTGWCNICGPQTGNYACAQGSGSGNWNNGIRTFNVVIPPGNVITGACVTVNKVNCGLTNICVNINGTNIQCQPANAGNCNCNSCWPQTFCANFSCPTGMPNFNYNGTNSVQIVNTGNLCVNNAVITLTYQMCCQSPTITTMASPASICPGQSSTLTANGAGVGGTYTWQPGGFVGQNFVVSPAVTTVYTVTGTNNQSCSGTQTVQVVVNPNPVITGAANPASVCLQGQTTSTITFGGGVSYTMQPGNIVGNSAVVSPVVPTVYTITGVSAFGCVGTGTVQVGINPPANPSASSPSVCQNSNLLFTAGGGTAYSWVGPNGFTSNQQNPTIPNSLPSHSGQYTVTVTSQLGCTASTVTTAFVQPAPNSNITHNAQNGGICFGSTLNLQGFGPAGASYSWSGPNGFMSGIQNPSIGPVSMQANGMYSLVVTVNSCTGIATSSVLINPLPNPILQSNSPVCLFQPITFTALGANTYTLFGPNNYLSNSPNAIIPSASNLAAGTYTLVGMDGNGCVNVTSGNVSINPLPVITAAGSTVCALKTITLTAMGGVSYTWTGPAGFTSSSSNTFIPNAALNMNGGYTVTVMDVNGCVSASVAPVKVYALPTPTAAVSTPVCKGKPAVFTSGDPAMAADAYYWNGPNGFYSFDQNTTIPVTETAMSGMYTLTAVDGNLCSGKYYVTLVVNPLPTALVSPSKDNGCAPVCSNFTLQSPFGLQNIEWKLNQGSAGTGTMMEYCFSLPGRYEVNATITDVFGCVGEAEIRYIDVYPVPSADFHIKPGIPVEGQQIEITDASLNANIKEWTWFFTEQQNNTSTVQNPVVTYEHAGSYPVALIVVSDKGCVDTIVKSIIVGEDFNLYVPNAFTPNFDGVNDVFQPKGYGISKYELSVFNRWGEKVFSTKEFTQGWDGTSSKNKELVQEGVYVWKILVTDMLGKSHELKGTVSLIK